MHVGVLGELTVTGDAGAAVEIRGAKLRPLLILLALSPGRAVPTEQLIDALWGEDPPAGVRNGLQALVSKLRRGLDDAALISTRDAGYALELAPEAVDAYRFEQLVRSAGEAAEAGDHRAAREGLLEAEGLWRGDALQDVAYERFAEAPIARLTELRLVAAEALADAELALGNHAAVVPRLEALVAEHPLRERLRGQLMVALYRSGRQADALRAFQDARACLAEELGLEPSPELRRLEAAILEQAPELDGPAPGPPAVADPSRRPSRWTVPEPVSDLVGRDDLVDELRAELAERRLVTLVGPGGVGKTRSALAAARAVEPTLADGAVVAELAPMGDAAGVRQAVASALNAPNPRSIEQLLGDAEVLLVLDNCEHLMDAAAELAEALLRSCPRLRILATSREALRIDGEVVRQVPPLAAPAAAALFRERARAAGGRADADGTDAGLVAEVCERLDGLPLAIELAAARTRAFPLEQLSARLDDRFRVLTGGSRTALPRQQTLRAVVDWSYDLLFEEQRLVFERLSTLPGGATLATARAVCADEEVPADDVEDILEALVDKSLVIVQPSGSEVRFVQLQTLLDYGREHLDERGDATAVHRRMAAHFADLSAHGIAAFQGEDQERWLASVHAEQANLRAALDWAIDAGDAEMALGIAGGVSWQKWLTGQLNEGKRWIDDAFACPGETTRPTRAIALIGRGYFDYLAGEGDDVHAPFAEAVDLLRQDGGHEALFVALGFWSEVAAARADIDLLRQLHEELLALSDSRPEVAFSSAVAAYSGGVLAALDGDLGAAEEHYRTAAQLFAGCGSLAMQTVSMGAVARLVEARGDLASAAAGLEEALAINERLHLVGFAAVTLSRLGSVLISAGDLDRAEEAITQPLDVGRRLGNTPMVVTALGSWSYLALQRGDLDDASRAATEVLVHLRKPHDHDEPELRPGWQVPVGAAMALVTLGAVALRRGDLDGAVARCREGLEQALQSRDQLPITVAVEVLAAAVLATGDARRAARLLGYAQQHRTHPGAPMAAADRAEVEGTARQARKQLGDAAFETALGEGRGADLRALAGLDEV